MASSLFSSTTQNHTTLPPSQLQGLYADQVLLLPFFDALAKMDFSWMVDFLKGMVKPLAATVVVLLAVALSYFQKLGLGGEMVYSIARAFVQLSIIGFVLQFIFTRNNAIWIVMAYLFMVIIRLCLSSCLLCVSFLSYRKRNFKKLKSRALFYSTQVEYPFHGFSFCSFFLVEVWFFRGLCFFLALLLA